MTESQSSLNALRASVPPAAPTQALAIISAAAVAIVLWAGTAIATKIAVTGFDPLLAGMMRSVGAGLVLLPILVVGRVRRPQGGRALMLLVTSSLGGFVFFPLLFAIGLRSTTASHGALILAALPILTGLVGAIMERRWPGWRWVLGCALSMLGEVALIVFHVGLDSHGSLAGDLLILTGALCSSTGYVTGSRLARSIGTWSATVWGNMLGGAIMLLPLIYLGAGVQWGNVASSVWGSVAYLAILSSVLGYVLWYWALAKGGVARVGTAQFAQPIMTLALAAAFLGETITLPLVLSALVILSGIYIAQKR